MQQEQAVPARQTPEAAGQNSAVAARCTHQPGSSRGSLIAWSAVAMWPAVTGRTVKAELSAGAVIGDDSLVTYPPLQRRLWGGAIGGPQQGLAVVGHVGVGVQDVDDPVASTHPQGKKTRTSKGFPSPPAGLEGVVTGPSDSLRLVPTARVRMRVCGGRTTRSSPPGPAHTPGAGRLRATGPPCAQTRCGCCAARLPGSTSGPGRPAPAGHGWRLPPTQPGRQAPPRQTRPILPPRPARFGPGNALPAYCPSEASRCRPPTRQPPRRRHGSRRLALGTWRPTRFLLGESHPNVDAAIAGAGRVRASSTHLHESHRSVPATLARPHGPSPVAGWVESPEGEVVMVMTGAEQLLITEGAPLSERHRRVLKSIVAVVVAGLWAFTLYLHVLLAAIFFLPSDELPDRGGVQLGFGVGFIVIGFLVAASTTWLSRRLGPTAFGLTNVVVMALLFILTWL